MENVVFLELEGLLFNNSENAILWQGREFVPLEFEFETVAGNSNFLANSVVLHLIFQNKVQSYNDAVDLFLSKKMKIWRLQKEEEQCLIDGVVFNVLSEGLGVRVVVFNGFRQLSMPINGRFSEICRVKFCSQKCGLKRENFQFISKIMEIAEKKLILENIAPKWHWNDAVAVLNSGKKIRIKIIDGNEALFYENVKVEVGQEVLFLPTCNGTFGVCGEYKNSTNFRGEPFIWKNR